MRIRERFNSHAPFEARRGEKVRGGKRQEFQPTRPLRGATAAFIISPFKILFQPTRPLRGATFEQGSISILKIISTHAPLAGRDGGATVACHALNVFQPTRPLRGATGSDVMLPDDFEFQPTRPLRGATVVKLDYATFAFISTHAPLAGRDSKSVQITMHIFAITDKFQMLLHRMPPVRAFCSFLMQENHADFGCEPPK